MQPVETARTILRRVRLEDAQDFFELDSNPNVHRYLGNQPVNNLEQSLSTVQSILSQYNQYGIGRRAIVKKEDGCFVGWCGLKWETSFKEIPYIDLGYRLKEEHWGQGYATEAAAAMLVYGHTILGIETICAAASTDNQASNHILTKIGMAKEGQHKYQDIICNWYVSHFDGDMLMQ